MTFYIKQNSELPILKMELINDGRTDYHKFHQAIQDAVITFSMVNVETGVIKISNAPCYIKRKDKNGCTDEYLICYNWKKRDTKEKGTFEGTFNIQFNGNITSDSTTYPSGELIMPICEKLFISIQ
ncbi:MAG: hypothetical protein IKT40_12135 [Bacilli bacterium]|nr:hypothetical protein [Bacilli bacterium]